MSLRTFLEIAFDELCKIPKEKDPELSKTLSWINDKAFKEGITTYQFVHKIIRVDRSGNQLSLT